MQLPITFRRYFALLGFLTLTSLAAQPEDLRNDTPFFEEKAQAYQRWLDHAGLGQYLRVYEIDVQERDLALYLAFPFHDIDSIRNAWDLLKTEFEANSPLTLEQQLFYKMTTLMEVRQTVASVQLYDTYDLRETPLFERIIYFKNGRVQLQSSDPKSKRRSFSLQPQAMGSGKAASVANFQRDYSREKVFDCIYAYAQQRYGETECQHRNPRVRLLEEEEQLRFEVTDLCREVLTDAANPTLCEILRTFGRDCNWVKREWLVFTLTYQPTAEGFRIDLLIDGKYGSGFYDNVRRGGYLDMEIDFDDYLEAYADEFKTHLRRHLRNCP